MIFGRLNPVWWHCCRVTLVLCLEGRPWRPLEVEESFATHGNPIKIHMAEGKKT